MSTSNSISITPPTEALLSIIETYGRDIREAAEKAQERIAMLNFPRALEEVVKVYEEKHREEVILQNSYICIDTNGRHRLRKSTLLYYRNTSHQYSSSKEERVPRRMPDPAPRYVLDSSSLLFLLSQSVISLVDLDFLAKQSRYH
jgi:hypothetical protein